MPRFLIHRDIPKIGSAGHEEFRAAAKKSNGVLAEMRDEKKNIQWVQSYVTADSIVCVYLAENEELIREHARRSGFPATAITPVRRVIDPITAEA